MAVDATQAQEAHPNEGVAVSGGVGRPPDGAAACGVPPTQTIAEAIETLREQVKHAFITYAWVLEADGKLVGVLTMRDLLFSPGLHKLAEVMLRSVFALEASMPVLDAMKLTLDKHFPVIQSPTARG